MVLGIVLAALLAGAGVAPAAMDKAVGVVMDVDGQIDVTRKGEGVKPVAAYVGMDLFAGDSVKGAGKLTVFYEKGGTVTHTPEQPLLIGEVDQPKDAPKRAWLSRFASTFSGLLGSREDVTTSEAGAVEAGVVLARVAERESAETERRPKQTRSGGGGGASNAASTPGAATESSLQGVPQDGAPQEKERIAEGSAQRPAVPPPPPAVSPVPGNVAASDSKPASTDAPAPADMDLGDPGPEPEVQTYPVAVAASPMADPTGKRAALAGADGGAVTQPGPRSNVGGAMESLVALVPGKKLGREQDRKDRANSADTDMLSDQSGKQVSGLGDLTLDSALARAKVLSSDGAVPPLDQVPGDHRTLVRMPKGEVLQADLAFGDGAELVLAVEPATGAPNGWRTQLKIAPAAEFAAVRSQVAPLLLPEGNGDLVAARLFEKHGFEMAAYLIQRNRLLKLQASSRNAASLRVLALQVSARALRFGDFKTLARIKPLLTLDR